MIDLTRAHALQSGFKNRVSAKLGDVPSNLDFKTNSFDAIIALGVSPWLADLNQALREISRVLVPGGYAIAFRR